MHAARRDVVTRKGIRLTGAANTFVDLGRYLTLVVLGDSLVAAGVTTARLYPR